MYAMKRWYNSIGVSLVDPLIQYCIIIVVEQIDHTTCVQNKVFGDLNEISSTHSTQLLSYQPFFLPARKKKNLFFSVVQYGETDRRFFF
jgi:hypothetical protein